MTDRLRSALAEIADRAPVAQVPDTTYRRGRRSYRQRIGAGALAVVLVCLGLGSLVRGATHDDPPVVGPTSRDAVPSQLYGVPQRLTMTDGRGRWTGPVEADLAIGTGAVAWETGVPGPPVVVTARDGAYHLLNLPGFLGNDPGWSGLGTALTLSPDGRSLAYAWASGHLGESADLSGIRVLDLVTGNVRTIPIETDGLGTLVQQIVWSPDSRWLSWSGATVVSENSLHGGVRGVVAPDSSRSRLLPSPTDAATAMAVDDTGRVALVTSYRTLLVSPSGQVDRYPGTVPRSSSLQGETMHAAFSPDGRLMSLSATTLARDMTTLRVGTSTRLLHGLPADVYPDGATIVPLGWLDDDHLLAVLDPEGPAQDTAKQRDLVVMTPTRGQTSSFRIVGHADGMVPTSISVAVDLMTPDRYTADLPEPDWPWSTDRKIVVGLLVAAGLLLAVWAGSAPMRRRRYLDRR